MSSRSVLSVKRGSRPALVEGIQHRLDEPRLALDVAVEEDHRVGGPLAHGAVDRSAKAQVLPQLEQRDLRELLAHQRRRVVAGAVVDDDHVDRPRLLPQAAQRLPKPLGAVVVRNVDGRTHAVKCIVMTRKNVK
jgi:hypothetical protein